MTIDQSSISTASDPSIAIAFAPTKTAFEKHSAPIVGIQNPREARVDLNAVFMRTIPVFPVLKEMRTEIEAKLPDLDLATYDTIEERVYAAHYCNTIWQAKVKLKEDVAAFAEALEERYDDALAAYDILIKFRLANDAPKKNLKAPAGYDTLAENASLLLGVLRGLAPEILNETPFKAKDVERLEGELLAFQSAWARREYSIATKDEAAVLRAQAFTYLYDAYELARRAAMYLYGLERANELVPSLYITNGERKRKSSATGEEEANAEQAVSGLPGANGERMQRSKGQAASGSDAVMPANFVMDNTANLPLTNPFELGTEKK